MSAPGSWLPLMREQLSTADNSFGCSRVKGTDPGRCLNPLAPDPRSQAKTKVKQHASKKKFFYAGTRPRS